MPSLNRICAVSVALFLAVPATASAQDDEDGWLSEFHFDQLRFVFWPSGAENRQESDGKGSALIVQADRVAITDWDALDVRHCLDGDDTWCSYPVLTGSGNKNEEVEQHEVDAFQNVAPVLLRSAIGKVDQLADTLQSNITVDGKAAKSVKITKLVLHDVLGTVDSNATIYADVEAKATYDNDKDAKDHVIHVGELKLKDDGFIYKQTIWKMGATGWKYDAGATSPEAGKKYVSEAGFFSSQDQFESLSVGGVDLHAVKSDGPKGKSPGLAPVLILAALAAVVGVVSRRK